MKKAKIIDGMKKTIDVLQKDLSKSKKINKAALGAGVAVVVGTAAYSIFKKDGSEPKEAEVTESDEEEDGDDNE